MSWFGDIMYSCKVQSMQEFVSIGWNDDGLLNEMLLMLCDYSWWKMKNEYVIIVEIRDDW